MEPVLIGTDFIAITDIDYFKSLIWTDRYCGYGDFEISLSPAAEAVMSLVPDRYLYLTGSDHVMIIESLGITTDVENGNEVLVRGRSLESILDRRKIWNLTVLTGSVQDAVELLLLENAISPDDSNRQISRLVFEESTDPAVTSRTVDGQCAVGDSLYDTIVNLCLATGLGFKITLTDDNHFLFKLYSGVDRTYAQELNPYVVFSPKYENLINANYSENKTALRTIALVAGEKGVGNERRSIIVEAEGGGGSDLERREMYVDAGDISKNIPEGGTLTDEQYLAKLAQRGSEQLAKNVLIQTFEGEADTTTTYVFKTDFGMGDLVEVANEYGHEARSRVVELIHSQDDSGVKIYPTFAKIS
jgi:hypothetical protein